MNKVRLLKLAVTLTTFALFALTVANSPAVSAVAAGEFDATAAYKAKCAMCHGKTAEKKFDATKADEVLVATTLKGKDDVKPKMPAYGSKGITEEQAKALVAHMKML